MAEDLTDQLRRLNAQVADLRREIARDYEPASMTVKRRRRALALVAVAMAGSLLVNNGAISRCFLGGPPTGIERRLCDAAFPGYAAARRESDMRLRQFTDLLRFIPDNARRVGEVERRVEKLERKEARR